MTSATIEQVQRIRSRADIPDFLRSISAEVVCEIGVRDGGNFGHLLVPSVKQAFAIDCWAETGKRSQNDDMRSQEVLESQYKHMLEWSERDKRIRVIRDYSVEAAKLFSSRSVDFAYLDADHTYEAACQDIAAWWPKIKRGGVLGGHDYCWMILEYPDREKVIFGVRKAVNEFVDSAGLQLHISREPPYNNWFVLKT